MTPLESRSLPGALWEKVPPEWVAWDINLQKKLSTLLDPAQLPLQALKFFTEEPLGIAVAFLSLFLCFLRLWKKSEWPSLPFLFCIGSTFLFAILVCDLLSSKTLKVLFGRLKPHVIFYNPDVLPALSLPSTHALNTAFVCFVLLRLRNEVSAQKRVFLFSLSFFLMVSVGISRVIVGQHYPLDVMMGWAFGGTLGFGLGNFFYRRGLGLYSRFGSRFSTPEKLT